MKMGTSFHPIALLPIQTHITTLRTGSPTIHVSNLSWQTSFTGVAKCLRATLTYYSALWMLYLHLMVTLYLSIIILTCMKKLMWQLLVKLHGSILFQNTVAHCPRVFLRQTFLHGWPMRMMSGSVIQSLLWRTYLQTLTSRINLTICLTKNAQKMDCIASMISCQAIGPGNKWYVYLSSI